jgi:hypothetical protein
MTAKRRQVNYKWRHLPIKPFQWKYFRKFGLKKETVLRHLYILSHNNYLKFPFGLKMKNQHDWFFILFLPKFIVLLKRGTILKMKRYPSLEKTMKVLFEAFRKDKKDQSLAYPLAKKLLRKKLQEKRKALREDKLIYFPSSKLYTKENKFLPYQEIQKLRRELSSLRALFRKVKRYYKKNPERRRLFRLLQETSLCLKWTEETEKLYKEKFENDFWAWLEWYYGKNRNRLAFVIRRPDGYEQRWWSDEELQDKRKALEKDRQLYEECYKRWELEKDGWIGASDWAREDYEGVKEEFNRRFGPIKQKLLEIRKFILKTAKFCSELRERRFYKYGKCFVKGGVRYERDYLPACRTTIYKLVYAKKELAGTLEKIKKHLPYA